jgi:hypothetical protein
MSSSDGTESMKSIGVGLIRIHFGIILLAHGWLTVSVFTVDGTVN